MVKEYDSVEDYYADPNVNFGEGVKINFGSTDPAQALGQNVNVSLAPQPEDNFRTPFLANLQNTKHNSSNDYNVFTGSTYSHEVKDFSDMLKQMGYTDKANSGYNVKNVLKTLATGPIDLKSAFIDPKGLIGPTGEPVLNLGMISEMEMKAHYDNFSDVADAYAQLGQYRTVGDYIDSRSTGFPSDKFTKTQGAFEAANKSLNLPVTKFNFNERTLLNTDVGFAATIGSFHFSRPPNRGYYNGLKSHIDGGSGNGHQMLKTMEALNKGLDPTGYRLDGKNEDNGGVTHSSKHMAAGITEDGYYISVANNGFGYTKSVLYGLAKGTESDVIAKEMGISQNMLVTAMGMARKDKDMTVTQAISKLKGSKVIPQIDLDKKDPDYFSTNTSSLGDDNNDNTNNEDKQEPFVPDYADMGMNEGGQIGQLATILRQNRLGMNVGGQAQQPEINVNELGFVDNKTPDQVTDAQSVADDKPINMRDNDYMLNSPAVKKHGIRNTVNMIMRGLKDASAAGVQIVDMPPDIPRDELVKVAASASEVRVPRDLVPFIGLANLETINEKGKPEVKRRARLT